MGLPCVFSYKYNLCYYRKAGIVHKTYVKLA